MRESRLLTWLAVLGLLSLLILPQVFAHAPLPSGSNESLTAATLVPDPTKSWAIHSELHEGGEAQYYRFDISGGKTIHVSLLKSTRPEEHDFLPSMVLIGPGLVSQDILPSFVEVPQGAGTMLVEGKSPAQATYEAFAPSAFYQLAELELAAPASGTYYVTVFDLSRGGSYGLAIGDRESFTVSEWVLAPLTFISVYQWEGQDLLLIFAPTAMTLAIGFLLLVTRWKSRDIMRTLHGSTGALAGLLFVSTGLTVLSQMLFASSFAPVGADVLITLTFGLIPLILGMVAIRLALRKVTRFKGRLSMAVLGLVALFTWSGFVVGPILVIVASILPRAQASIEKGN